MNTRGPRSRSARGLQALTWLLLLTGGLLALRASYLHAKAALAAHLIRHAWASTLVTHQAARPWPWADTHPIGRLVIPALRYDEVILDNSSPRTLAFGPARLASSATLGQPGNVVLAGHRTNWFAPLEQLRLGDRLELHFAAQAGAWEERRGYRVTALRVVAPEDASWLQPSVAERLTLVTCYPFGRAAHSPQRYVVLATPVALTVDGEHGQRG